jgi:hypothetical protein
MGVQAGEWSRTRARFQRLGWSVSPARSPNRVPDISHNRFRERREGEALPPLTNAARWDLCGGPPERAAPTAIRKRGIGGVEAIGPTEYVLPLERRPTADP